MTKLDSWVRADKEGEGGVRGGVPHEVGFVVNLFILSFIFYLLYVGGWKPFYTTIMLMVTKYMMI